MAWLSLMLCCFAPAADPAPNQPGADAARAVPNMETAEYPVEGVGRSTHVFLLPRGPRTVRALEVAPTEATAEAWRGARIRLTWDDDDPDPKRAGVDLPLGLAFGQAKGRPPVASTVVSAAGNRWVVRFPMPYHNLALLRIDADAPISGTIRLRTEPGVERDSGYFRAADFAPGSDQSRESARGRLAGLFVAGDASTLTVSLDGGPSRRVAEVLGPTTDRQGPYRWFVADPIRFGRSFAFDDPEASAGRSSGASALLFWYSERPAPGRIGR